MKSEQLEKLTEEAHSANSKEDASAANSVLERLSGISDSDFDALGPDDLKLVMETSSALGQIGDIRLIANLFARSINAMHKFDIAAAEYIIPLYNMRAAYLALGASDESSQALGQIVAAARRSNIVSMNTIRVLGELTPEFENAGYIEAASALFRPLYETIVANPEMDWEMKMNVTARYGRLQLADNRAPDAIETYQHTLKLLDTSSSDPDVIHARMALQSLLAEAHTRGGAPDAAEAAYQAALSIAEASNNLESKEVSAISHNLAGLWMANKRRDRYPEAVELTKRSLEIAEKLGTAGTSGYAAGFGQLAILHAQLGDAAAAQLSFDDCFAAFTAAEDANPADVADYRVDEGQFRLDIGQADRATDSFSIATEVRDAIEGFPREKLADSHAWLGVARFEHGDWSQASEAFRKAIQLRLSQLDRDSRQGES